MSTRHGVAVAALLLTLATGCSRTYTTDGSSDDMPPAHCADVLEEAIELDSAILDAEERSEWWKNRDDLGGFDPTWETRRLIFVKYSDLILANPECFSDAEISTAQDFVEWNSQITRG